MITFTLITFRLSPLAINLLQRFAHGFLDDHVGLFLAVDIVEADQVVAVRLLVQQVAIKPVGLPHTAPHMVAIHGMPEDRLGRPYEYLGLILSRHIGHAQRPAHEMLALAVELLDAQLAAQTIGF